MIAGGFGPFSGAELTGVLHEATATTNRRLTSATLHDVQLRGGHYYAIAEVTAHHHGGVGHFYYGLTTAPVPIEAPGRAISYGGHSMFVWEHPQDPLLPGLKLAATPSTVRRNFTGNRQLTGLHTVIYRPMNRAVFKAYLAPLFPGAVGDTIYLKVLRPDMAAGLYDTHLTLGQAGVPVATPVRPPIKDVLALAGGHGMPLGELIRSEGAHNPFDPRELIEILDRFPPEVMDYPYRRSWAERRHDCVAVARQALPGSAGRFAHLGNRLEQAHQGLDLGPLVPTHADRYEAHILVDPSTGRIQHILDIDGAGPGYRVDDYACLIGHLAVLGQPGHHQWGWQTAQRFFQQLAPYTNPVALAVRSAAVVLSLIPAYQPDDVTRATGAAYLSVAEQLLGPH